MQEETGPSSTAKPDSPPKSSGIAKGVVVGAALVLTVTVGVVGVLIYGLATKAGWVGVTDKKAWDYLDVFLVPVALTVGVVWLTWEQNRRQREAEEAQQELEREAEEARREREKMLENQRAQDTVLQEYLSQMANLLIDRKLLELSDRSREDPPRLLARSRTLWVLWQIDVGRKAPVLRFLHEARLIQHTRTTPANDTGIVWLSGADLRGAKLQYINLEDDGLDGADLKYADLTEGCLKGANLGGADLMLAKLCRANLIDAQLVNAILSDVDLSGANLSGAEGVTEEQLERAQSLKSRAAIALIGRGESVALLQDEVAYYEVVGVLPSHSGRAGDH